MKGKPACQRLFTQLCRGDSRNSGQTLSGEEGLTLIECIMAIVVIGLTGAAVAPMMLVSVATRVQSQKTEQALELAQSEIDSVRVLFEQGEVTPALLPPVLTGVAGDRAPNVAGPISLAD
ncbi:MAG: type II secretion system protein, partial [Cyanobacteria bacterium P01_E01_bin.43]